jgi:tripartite motif-containing protein 71
MVAPTMFASETRRPAAAAEHTGRDGVRRFVRFVVAGVVALTVALQGAPAVQAAVSFTSVRTIGGPGHAGLYGWGADTMADGTVLVGDYWNLRVQRFSTTGQLLGTVVPNDGNHEAPYDVAVDTRDGTVYVGDVDGSATVDKYRDGVYLGTLGVPGQFIYPSWIDVDAQGRVAVADSRAHKIAVFDDTGALLYEFGTQGGGAQQVRTPRGVDFAPDGRLFVLDSGNARVQIFTLGASSATSVARFPITVGDHRGLLVHPTSGDVFVVGTGPGKVTRYTQAGVVLGSFGSVGTGAGQFIEGGRGITADGDGNVWIGDMPNFRAQKFSPTGTYLQQVPSPPEPPLKGGFRNPGAIDVAPNGQLVINDSFNWRIQTLQPDGTFVRQFGNRAHFNYARGVAVDPRDGSIVVANSDGQNLKKFSATGQLQWTSVKGFRSYSVAVAADGTIYAADGGGAQVRVFSSAGVQVATFGTGVASQPRGIEVDPVDGSIWLVGSLNGRIAHFGANGTLLGTFGSAGGGTGQLVEAADIEVDASRVYVADKGAHRIKVWTKSGSFEGAYGAKGTGPGQFDEPMGLALAPNGNLLVLEAGNERIQELSIAATSPDLAPPDTVLNTPSAAQVLPFGPVAITGTATDDVGVTAVRVAIKKQGVNEYWDGTAWVAGMRWLDGATLSNPGTTSTSWSYTWSPPSTGAFNVTAAALDGSGKLDPAPRPARNFSLR